MRKFRIWDQDSEPYGKIVTEEQIRETYYPYWTEQMNRVHGSEEDWPCANTFENALDDWIVVNWAVEIFEK